MSDRRFGCPVCDSTNVLVRSDEDGYNYDEILRWDEGGVPAETRPFHPSPRDAEDEDTPLSEDARERLTLTRYCCWSCGAHFPEPARLEGTPYA